MSGGRVELGLGAGWFEAEHAAYGIPFPPLRERFDVLEEQLAVITGMWSAPEGSTYDHDGSHYPVSGNPALVRTAQPGGVPIVVGGGGKRRTPALAARYAAEFNAPFSSPEETAALFERVDEVCEEHGRDPRSLVHSAAQVLCVGADEATLSRRAAAIGRDAAELRANGVAGSPEEARDRLGRLAEAGVERVYLQVLDLGDLDHLADAHAALTTA